MESKENIKRQKLNEAKKGENQGFRKNPIITSIYTADPAPIVFGDTLYLYTTHDEDQLINDFYTMFNWRCYSTKDMVNWVDHGELPGGSLFHRSVCVAEFEYNDDGSIDTIAKCNGVHAIQ